MLDARRDGRLYRRELYDRGLVVSRGPHLSSAVADTDRDDHLTPEPPTRAANRELLDEITRKFEAVLNKDQVGHNKGS